MKFSDLDKNLLTEAPAADGGSKEGKMARMGTKLKKKLGPTKQMRNRAEGMSEVQDEALNIKQAFQKWAGSQGAPNTAKSLIAFFQNNNYNEAYAEKVPEIAVKLQFEPEGFDRETEKPADEPTADQKPDATGNQEPQADEVGDEEQEELISPEEMTGEKSSSGEQSEEEVRAAYAKQGEELEAKRKASPDGELQDESVEEDSDDSEPKVDMSASIYESRLAYLLMEDTKLKDNQMDTLLVRLVQAVGVKSQPQQQEPQQEPQADEPKKDSLLKKAGKAYNKGMNTAFGDLHGRDSGDDDDSSSGSDGSGGSGLTSTERKQLKIILKQAIDGKQLDKDQRRVAKELLGEI